MSKMLFAVFFSQIILCISTSIGYWLFHRQSAVQNSQYLPASSNIAVESILDYFTLTLLLNTMIPISLIITLEISKVVQGYFIKCDIELYSSIRKKLFCDKDIAILLQYPLMRSSEM
jgi:magnesium-transporting ATPase (P-type)